MGFLESVPRDFFGEIAAAWAAWADGQSTQDLTIAGMTLLWWARVGKLAQFVAGTVVLLDIVGPDRIEGWAVRATRRTEPVVQRVQAMLRITHKLPFLFLLHVVDMRMRADQLVYVTDRDERRRLRREGRAEIDRFYTRHTFSGEKLTSVYLLAGLIAMIWFVVAVLSRWLYPLLDSPSAWEVLLYGAVFLAGSWSFIALWVTGLNLLHAALASLFYLGMIRPLVWVLRMGADGAAIKIAAFLLFCWGFQLDLLGS